MAALSLYFFFSLSLHQKMRQGELFMHKEMVCDFVLSAFRSELRDKGHRLLNFLFCFYFYVQSHFRCYCLKVHPERLLGLFFKTFYNLQFSVTNIHRLLC